MKLILTQEVAGLGGPRPRGRRGWRRRLERPRCNLRRASVLIHLSSTPT